MVWQVGVLLVGVGFLLLSLFASFTLLNMTRSLRTIESILTLTLDEARLALPEVRHSLQQIDGMVSGVNDKFTAADRAMNATGAAIACATLLAESAAAANHRPANIGRKHDGKPRTPPARNRRPRGTCRRRL